MENSAQPACLAFLYDMEEFTENTTPPRSPAPIPPSQEETPKSSIQSEASGDLNAIRCRHLTARLDQWTRNVQLLDPESPESVARCQQLSAVFGSLSQTVDKEAWEWLRPLASDCSAPLALALSQSHEQAELAHLSIVLPILATPPPSIKPAPVSVSSHTGVVDESVVELARRQLQELIIPKIPVFEGDVLTYGDFKRNFQTEIHRLALPAAKRLQALRSCLKGPPLSIVQNATSTEEGYLYAWETLDARYEGRLRVASAMVDNFLHFPEPHPSIEACIAWLSSRQILLDQCSIPHPLDFLLCHITLSNLAPGLQEEFRKKYLRSFDELPCSSQVLDFLKDQGDRLSPTLSPRRTSPPPVQASPSPSPTPPSHQPASIPSPSQVKPYSPKSVRFVPRPPRRPSSSSPPPRPPPIPSTPRAPTSSTSSSIQCYLCGDPHRLSKCAHYVNLSVSDKWDLVTEKNLCTNCLSIYHPVSRCPCQVGCAKCHGEHHTSLHPPPPSASLSQRRASAPGITPLMSLRTSRPSRPKSPPKRVRSQDLPESPPPFPRRSLLPPSSFEPHLPLGRVRDSESRPSSSSSSDELPPVHPVTYFGRHPAPPPPPEL
uniref:Uncharacterized protein n=1 Tax=Rhodnius prolixus TaxID=13249 RepID=T1I7P9_RHOPR